MDADLSNVHVRICIMKIMSPERKKDETVGLRNFVFTQNVDDSGGNSN